MRERVRARELHGVKREKVTNSTSFTASKEVKHKLILDEHVAIPDSTEVAKEILSRPVEPRPQPEGLKMRFKPYGFDTGN